MVQICPISNYQIISSDSWIFEPKFNNTYKVIVTIIDTDILHLEVSGFVNEIDHDEVWLKIEKIISKQFKGGSYSIIHNYKNFKEGAVLPEINI